MKPMTEGEKPSCAPRSAISVPCSPLPPSRMPAAISSGIRGRREDKSARSGGNQHPLYDLPAQHAIRQSWAGMVQS